jgi:hypothetical protein
MLQDILYVLNLKMQELKLEKEVNLVLDLIKFLKRPY